MKERVLFVDDDERILRFAERSLGRQFECLTATSAEQALEILTQGEPVAVIVSDDNMPGTRGTQLLAEARRIAPDTIRIMLTGYADQSIAVDAVNRGAVFRFLNKPVRLKTLTDVVELGVRQHRLVRAERELLDCTLRETVGTLSDVMGLSSPANFGRTARLRHLSAMLTPYLAHVAQWELETAVALAPIGRAGSYAVTDGSGDTNDSGKRRLAEDTEAAAMIIARIPRLQSVAGGIRYQFKNFDGTGFPRDSIRGKKIPLLGRVLRLVREWEDLQGQGLDADTVAERLRETPGLVDPDLLENLASAVAAETEPPVRRMSLAELSDGMRLAEDVVSAEGTLLVSRGHRVHELLRRRLLSLEEAGVVSGTIAVVVPDHIGRAALHAAG
ncbi:HD domain-containing phosphohydrolase [Lentisalinibacter salinarum]|uniref:HD domain-containing phosphohydrolase n=1 Tax=Lentisalinibacter salinarum TaxID=2992239 RepID=UPI003866D65E